MMTKQPKPKRCRICKTEFIPRSSLQVVDTPKCAIELSRQKAAKKERKEHREAKQRLKTLSQLCAETQKDVNRYIVARDKHKGCISCSGGEVSDAGHMIHAGSKYRTNRIRFDHRVINGQCQHCNRYSGGGNQAGYIDGYLSRFGAAALEEVRQLKRKADRGELEPLTREEVRQIASEHRRMKREIEVNYG